MKITVVGNVGKVEELRKVNNGGREDSVLSFWIAENITKRDGSREARWHKVTLWRKYAETMAKYVTVGRKIMVNASNVKAKAYTNKQSQIVPYIDIQADDVELLDRKPQEEAPEEVETTAEIVEDATPWD